MTKGFLAVVAAATVAWAPPALSQAQADAQALEERLADAQKRLEEAAREIAELSGEAAQGEGLRRFEYLLPTERRAMLGVNLGGIERDDGGVRVQTVSPGGPAAEAGVKAGDVIVAIQSRPVATGREIVRVMESIEPGDKVVLRLRRDGNVRDVTVTAREFDLAGIAGASARARVHAFPELPARALEHAFEWDGHWLLDTWGDAEFVTLSAELGRYFGAEKGVLVARAPGDDALGLEDGDVIVAIGGREPENARHAMRILRSYEPGERVEIRILRERRAETLATVVPERRPRELLRRARPPAPPQPPAPPSPPESARSS